MGPYNKITFTKDYRDVNDRLYAERSIEGERADYLSALLSEFVYFLHSAGFTYVDELVAHCGDDDCTHSSSDEE